VLLAAASGSLASGPGHAVRSAALEHLSATRAALVQLPVPVRAAAGGARFVTEALTAGRAVVGSDIFGSIALRTVARKRRPHR
jgi:hypothetical protein